MPRIIDLIAVQPKSLHPATVVGKVSSSSYTVRISGKQLRAKVLDAKNYSNGDRVLVGLSNGEYLIIGNENKLKKVTTTVRISG